ncbi:NAD-dependent epimerase/dehydratase family protein, partial [Candidatus Fermentibacteria bacterium]|nr:NAD-dependent epimerase/dehydratase family protein [Candidatus Fermentibacteria bacterium]
MSRHFLVTGATGFIGSHLVRQLTHEGHRVSAVVRNPERSGGLADLGVELHTGDVAERESIRGPMAGCDGVFHVAGWYKIGLRYSADAQRVNVTGTRNVLSLARELGIPKTVYTSTVAVSSDTKGRLMDETYRFTGRHLSAYDESKWRAHYEVAQPMIDEGVPLVIVMPGVVYGPGDTSSIHAMLVQYLRRKLPVVPQVTEFCWAHVDDIARAHILA